MKRPAMRYLVVIAAAAAAILLFLLTSASANTTLFERHFPLLIALNGAVVIGLAALVLYQLRGLWREYRARVFGARLKYRLLVMFALMALLPGLLVYAVSVQFAVRSIESWFDVRVDGALEGGINLGRSVLDNLLEDLAAKGRSMALDLGDQRDARTAALLNRLREQSGVESATLLATSGTVLASSSAEIASLLPELPPTALLRQLRTGRPYAGVESGADGTLTLRVLVPLAGGSISAENRVLQLLRTVPPSIAENAERVQAVYRDYQELSLARQGLKRIYTLTLTLTLLLALLGAIAFAFVLSRRLSAPLSILAEGTAAVAQGDYTPRQALPPRDELGVLTQSFNRMTRQLDEARAQAERSRAEVEAARAYLESVLAHLSNGVLAFDAELRLRASNLGARNILGDAIDTLAGRPLGEWPHFGALRAAIAEAFGSSEGAWQRQVEMGEGGALAQTLLVRGSRLPASGGGGHVVVFDDITQLIAAQRSAAWGEVARRLAHEIKNPLTPIQLSAERLHMKLADKLDTAGRAMLERATTTIVNQVEAMKTMVNAFRDYARLPAPSLAPVDLAALVAEVLALYESAPVPIAARLAAGLAPVAGDGGQLRQLIHNLLQNAEDALAETAGGRIEIAVEAAARGAELVVSDNGPGFAPAILARAFEPYVTTKSRGTGLGLAIVKKIVDEHGGLIRVANRPGGGAEVRVALPWAAR